MRSPAPMHNVALRWGGVGLSTYGTCSVDAVRPSCSTQAKKRLMVILLSMRQHDPSTGPQSPVRAGRQSARPTRVESGQRRDARRSHTAAQRPRRPTPGRTGHRARATTQHARQVAHDTPASHRGRAQGPGRGRGELSAALNARVLVNRSLAGRKDISYVVLTPPINGALSSQQSAI